MLKQCLCTPPRENSIQILSESHSKFTCSNLGKYLSSWKHKTHSLLPELPNSRRRAPREIKVTFNSTSYQFFQRYIHRQPGHFHLEKNPYETHRKYFGSIYWVIYLFLSTELVNYSNPCSILAIYYHRRRRNIIKTVSPEPHG